MKNGYERSADCAKDSIDDLLKTIEDEKYSLKEQLEETKRNYRLL